MKFTANKFQISKLNGGFIFVIVIFFALFLRTFQLDNRPMHTDEAVHAVKFGELLENGSYKYDPIEFHGPTLNYFTLIPAYLLGENNLQNIDEYTLRLVPAIISLLLIVSLLLMYNKSNYGLLITAAFLFAISPVLQFYSRYYIQESLLVTFTYSSLLTFYRYFRTKNITWLILSGILVGLIFATKETSIIAFFAAAMAFVILSVLYKYFRNKTKIPITRFFVFIVTAVCISALFYSSFFNNAHGIIDSILTFDNYFNKAGNNIEHAKPWYYYIKLMFYSNNNLIFYSGIPVFIFTLAGVYFAFASKYKIENVLFFRFLTIFSFTQTIIYSFISYKTPWLVLNFWIGFIIIAAFGIYQTFQLIKSEKGQTFFSIAIVVILLYNSYQMYITSFEYPYKSENPFTYSQPTQDIITLSNKVISVADTSPDSNGVLINVISKDNDYWPLPWYLRKLKNVAWNNHIPDNIYKFPMILAVPQIENELINKLYSLPPPGKKNLYVPLFDEYLTLRPGVEIRAYVQKKYYDFYIRSLDKTLE